MKHNPVLLQKVLSFIKIDRPSIVIDATFGGGGYSKAILERFQHDVFVLSYDLDPEAVFRGRKEFRQFENFRVVCENFRNIQNFQKNIPHAFRLWSVACVLFDLGFSSLQVSCEEIGMSFREDQKLDMRFGRGKGEASSLSASDVLNNYPMKKIEKIFREFGELKNIKKVLTAIEDFRKQKKFQTTRELAVLIEENFSERRKKIHPATRFFQALRMYVNDELGNLSEGLLKALQVLSNQGVIVCVSYHSLEDRCVKFFFRTNSIGCICPVHFPECRCGKKRELTIITKKPICPSEAEICKNPRARSARLRVAVRRRE